MIKLSRKLEYALISLKHLKLKSRTQELTSAKEITLKYAVPFDVVSRVLQILNQNGVVKSIQGVHGGYHLIKSLDELSMKELIEYIEGPMALVKCLSGEDDCELKTQCNILTPVGALNEKLKNFYAELKLSEILVDEPYAATTAKTVASSNGEVIHD
jgi:Rrf2 family protein